MKTLSNCDLAIKFNVDNGLISVDAENGIVYGRSGKRLQPWINAKYLRIGLRFDIHNDGKERLVNVLMHRIIAYAVWGNKLFDDGVEVNHKDLNKENNKASNLELVTRGQNIFHMYQNNPEARQTRARKNEDSLNSKLTWDQVREIRKRALAKERYEFIAKDFGISKSLVCMIKQNKAWTEE